MLVTCMLYGGLGNQLFQIFATIAYSINHNMKFKFKYTTNLGKRNTYWHTLFASIIGDTSDEIEGDFYQIDQDNPAFFDPPFNKDIMLNGYFQSPDFFETHFVQIRDILQLDQRQKCCKNEHAISMHFRLGDYKDLPDYHPILNVDYYKDALQYILLMDPSITCVEYFCEDDDLETVKTKIEIIRQEFRNVVFERRRMDTDWEELLLMSNNKHNIIANSTFSWWAAYLNTNEDKIVCYPSIWFGRMIPNDVKAMFPRNWIKI